MAKSGRVRILEGPGGRIGTQPTFEEAVDLYLRACRLNPESAFCLRHWSGHSHYIPMHSVKLLSDLWFRGLASTQILLKRIELMSSFDSSKHLPSAPYRTARYFVYFKDSERRIRGGHGFMTPGAACGMIQLVLKNLGGSAEVRWTSPTSVDTGCGLVIESTQLEDIMEANPVSLPHPYPSLAAGIAGKDPILFMPEEGHAPETKRHKPKRSKGRRTAEPRGPQPSGSVTPTDLAAEFNLSPSVMRKFLRKNNIAKPYRWEPGPQLDSIRSKLGKGV